MAIEKQYLATKALQDETNSLVAQVSEDIHDTFEEPDISEIGIFKADFINDQITVNKGCLMPDDRQIIC